MGAERDGDNWRLHVQDRLCTTCGQPMPPELSTLRRYCTAECKAKAVHLRWKAKRLVGKEEYESTTMQERASVRECTTVRERASAHENARGDERAMAGESTSPSERARVGESTIPWERAKRCECTMIEEPACIALDA